MPLSSGEGQKEGILLLVLKRHFVFKSREKNVKHLELRALSAQSFKHNFHQLHRTCCAPVAVRWGHLWTQTMNSLTSTLRSWWGCTPSLLGVTGKGWCLAPGSLLCVCRPAIKGLNSESHGRVCLRTGFWHFQTRGWPLPKFGFSSCCQNGWDWDFWCNCSVCVWLTQGRGFLKDTCPH